MVEPQHLSAYTEIDRIADRVVGQVSRVEGSSISLVLLKESPRNVYLEPKGVLLFPRLNSIVLFQVEGAWVIGMITSLSDQEQHLTRYEQRIDDTLLDMLPSKRIAHVMPLGTMTGVEHSYRVDRGVDRMPAVGDVAIIPTVDQVTAVFAPRGESAHHISIGTIPIANNAPAYVDPDVLFARHTAVFGSTGSGKSCTVAAIVRETLKKAKANKEKQQGRSSARFVIFDLNGEYGKCFGDLSGLKILKVGETAGDNQLEKAGGTAGDNQLVKVEETAGDDQLMEVGETAGDDQLMQVGETAGDDQLVQAGETAENSQLVKVFKVGETAGDNQLVLPAWFWNTDEWAAILEAAPGVQRPLLKQSLSILAAIMEKAGEQGIDVEKKQELKDYLPLVICQLVLKRDYSNGAAIPDEFRACNAILRQAAEFIAEEDLYIEINGELQKIVEICDSKKGADGESVKFDVWNVADKKIHQELSPAVTIKLEDDELNVSVWQVKSEKHEKEILDVYAKKGAMKYKIISLKELSKLSPDYGSIKRPYTGKEIKFCIAIIGEHLESNGLPEFNDFNTAGRPDVPVSFPVDLILKALEITHAMGGGNREHVATMIARAETMLHDARIDSIINPKDEEHNKNAFLQKWLGDILGTNPNTGEGTHNVTVIDFSLVPSEIIHIIVGVIARMLMEFMQRRRVASTDNGLLPTVLVLEEAHSFVSRDLKRFANESAARLCRNAFERIAREGRKFGLGMVISSQRPSEITETVLSQCNSFFVHRITNEPDQKILRHSLPDTVAGLVNELPALPQRHCYMVGMATDLPTKVEVMQLAKDQRPQSNDPEYMQSFQSPGQDSSNINSIKSIVEKWQNPNQNKSEAIADPKTTAAGNV